VISLTQLKTKLFKKDVKQGAVWSIIGFGADNFIRMISSLVLTRIFLPEVFGVMAILFALNMAFEMISDIGIRYSIIQNRFGNKKIYQETAWSLQIIRGFILWLILCLCSEPIAMIFDSPELADLLPYSSLPLLIAGFNSVGPYLYSRRLGVIKLVVNKAIVNVLSLILVIVLSIKYQSIWCIVIGAIFTAVLNMVTSHMYYKSKVTAFRIHKKSAGNIIRFGKWLLLATIFHFFTGQGDRLLLGLVWDKESLGLYNLASMFAYLPIAITVTLASSIIMPFLAKTSREAPEQFKPQFRILIDKVVLFSIPFPIVLFLLGPMAIKLLYTPEYYLAADILPILSVGSLYQCMTVVLASYFLGGGKVFQYMALYLAGVTFLCLCVFMLGQYNAYQLETTAFFLSISKAIWFYCSLFYLWAKVKVNLVLPFAIGTCILILTIAQSFYYNF